MSTDKVKSRVTSTDMTATTLDDVFESGTVRQDEYFDDEQIYNDVRDFENDDLPNRADVVHDSSVAAVSSGLDEDADESNLEENNKLCSDEADSPNIADDSKPDLVEGVTSNIAEDIAAADGKTIMATNNEQNIAEINKSYIGDENIAGINKSYIGDDKARETRDCSEEGSNVSIQAYGKPNIEEDDFGDFGEVHSVSNHENNKKPSIIEEDFGDFGDFSSFQEPAAEATHSTNNDMTNPFFSEIQSTIEGSRKILADVYGQFLNLREHEPEEAYKPGLDRAGVITVKTVMVRGVIGCLCSLNSGLKSNLRYSLGNYSGY
jgi:hypothetical protein